MNTEQTKEINKVAPIGLGASTISTVSYKVFKRNQLYMVNTSEYTI